MSEYVYIVKSGDWFKIGQTTFNVNSRLNDLQTGNPIKIELYAVYNFDNARSKAQQYERVLHSMFRHQRGIGEWFYLSPDDLLKINDYCLKHGATVRRGTATCSPISHMKLRVWRVISKWMRDAKNWGDQYDTN